MSCCDELDISGTTQNDVTLVKPKLYDAEINGGSIKGSVIGKDCDGNDVVAGTTTLATCNNLAAAERRLLDDLRDTVSELPPNVKPVAIGITSEGKITLTLSDGTTLTSNESVLTKAQFAAIFRDCDGSPLSEGVQLAKCSDVEAKLDERLNCHVLDDVKHDETLTGDGTSCSPLGIDRDWFNDAEKDLITYINTNKLVQVQPDDKTIIGRGTNNDRLRVQLSRDDGNELSIRDDGLYYGAVPPAEIRELYVSNSGSDLNAGTHDAPLRTPDHALDIIADRGISGTYRIFLKAGETFALNKRHPLGTPLDIIRFSYYDDPVFGNFHARQGWFPYTDARLKRPELVFDTYLDSNGLVQATDISSAAQQGSVIFEGIDITFKNSAGNTTGGGWFLYFSVIEVHGGTVTIAGDYIGVGSATNIILLHNDYVHTGKSKVFVADKGPQIFTKILGDPGTVVHDPYGQGPDVTIRACNLQSTIKVADMMALASYDTNTKTLFGFNVNFDIFANG